jgi:hypothetical protein
MDGNKCDICTKEYASYKSLWNHNTKFHNNIQSKNNINHHMNASEINIIQHKNVCKFCSKQFEYSQSKYRHQKTCNKNSTNKIIEENIILKNELLNMNKTVEDLKKQMKELMNKQYKMHPKTLQKINKQLNMTNSHNTSNVNNIVNVIQLGKEDLDNVLSQKEQLNILNKDHNSLEYMIKYIHFNDKYPQYKNIMITNQQNNIAYRYDKKENKFIATDKNELVDELVSCRTADIEEFLDNNINRLEAKTISRIKEFINKITYDDKYDELKKKDIKLLIYNNRDKLTKEIYQDLEVILQVKKLNL